MRTALFLIRKDLKHLFRARETWIWAFVMPVLLTWFIGSVTGQGGAVTPGPEPVAVWIEGGTGAAGDDFLAAAILKRLEERQLKVIRVGDRGELARYARRLTIPAGFTRAVLEGKPQSIEFSTRSTGAGSDYDTFRIRLAAYLTLADLVLASRGGAQPTAGALEALAAQPRLLTVRVEAAGRLRRTPTGFEQAAPGMLVMFTIIVLLTAGAMSLYLERRRGILRRLASSPVERGWIVFSKWTVRLILGLVQIGWALVAAAVLFKVNWGPNLPAVALLLVAYAALIGGVGLLLANFARSEGQVVGLGVLAGNVLAALGGCWWPIEVTPRWAQTLALFLPTGWAMDGLHKLVSFGLPPASVLTHVAALAGSALVVGLVLARRFRFE